MVPESGDDGRETVFCTNCGEEIFAEAEMCPECGETQKEAQAPTAGSIATEGGFTSWGIGFKPGSMGRNILVGLGYLFVWPLGIALLLIGYGRRGDAYKKRAMAIGMVLILLLAVGAVFGEPADQEAPNQQSDDPGTANAADTSPPPHQVKIIYSGSWSGSIGYMADGSSKQESYDGTGDGSVSFNEEVDQISASIQKRDDGQGRLTVQILEDGEVVAESSTSAEYGVASISESFY